MTTMCPAGHPSATADYCDQCGARIESSIDHAVPLAQSAEILGAVTAVVNLPRTTEHCPACDAPRATSDRFCESCGFDFAGDSSQVPAAMLSPAASRGPWQAVITADREYFKRVAPDGLTFPDDPRSQTFVLENGEFPIGRHEAGGDPAVSRLHAVIVHDGDVCTIVDKGSTNGTRINDDPNPIDPNVPLPLGEGDRIYLGAWTTITVHRDGPTSDVAPPRN